MKQLLTLAFLLSAGLAATTQAAADVPFSARSTVITVKTAKPDFSDATLSAATTVTVPAQASGSRDFYLFTPSSLQSQSISANGALTASSFIFSSDKYYSEIDGHVVATGPAGGSFTLNEGFAADTTPDGNPPLFRYANGSVYTDPNYPYLPAFTKTDLPSLEVYLPFDGANLVDEGGSYSIQILIPGDYSTTGGLDSGTGQHYFSYVNPDFKIGDDFVYDPVTNQTSFTLLNPHYSYNALEPTVDLDIFFFGAPAAAVPEPASWAMTILGVGLIGTLVRRRQAIGTPALA